MKPNTTKKAKNRKAKATSKKPCHAEPVEACNAINLSEIENIELMFTYKGKLYVLMPKPDSKNDARICMETALRLALDKHSATEVLDADIEDLKKNLNEIAKEH